MLALFGSWGIGGGYWGPIGDAAAKPKAASNNDKLLQLIFGFCFFHLEAEAQQCTTAGLGQASNYDSLCNSGLEAAVPSQVTFGSPTLQDTMEAYQSSHMTRSYQFPQRRPAQPTSQRMATPPEPRKKEAQPMQGCAPNNFLTTAQTSPAQSRTRGRQRSRLPTNHDDIADLSLFQSDTLYPTITWR